MPYKDFKIMTIENWPEPLVSECKLTVIIRNDGPMHHLGDSATYRSVSIELTDEQKKQIQLKCTHKSGGTPYYEEISRCFIEPVIPEK